MRWMLGNINGILGPAGTGGPTRGHAIGVFGTPLKDLLTVEGNYTLHFKASYGDACTATRELIWSVHVDPGIDPSRTGVTTDISGGRGTITVIPRDKYGNNVGPGRGDGISVTGASGTTVTGPLRDNGDGSHTAPASWDPPFSGNSPGVVIGQTGRPPVIIHAPTTTEKDSCRKWKILFWVTLIVALLLLLLLILS